MTIEVQSQLFGSIIIYFIFYSTLQELQVFDFNILKWVFFNVTTAL